jgi:hypothetical protein
MAIYNVVYSSPDRKAYLWNGQDFDLLPDSDDDKLFFSGKTYDDNEVTDAMLKSRDAAHHIFPGDADPKIEKKEIPVNDHNSEGGHHQHMSS